MKFIELIAGIGGFRYGLESSSSSLAKQKRRDSNRQNNSKPSRKRRNRHKKKTFDCVWVNEIDKYACQVYRRNYGKKELYEGDIRKVNSDIKI